MLFRSGISVAGVAVLLLWWHGGGGHSESFSVAHGLVFVVVDSDTCVDDH